jgi:dTDP-4-dehydrorhamnose 3,5-epimerase
MRLIQTEIPDVVLLKPRAFEDGRGWFMEAFNERVFHDGLRGLGLAVPGRFVQDSHSFSNRGVLRGMHFQLPPHAQGKLCRVIKGAVFDVAVDLRQASATFGRWVAKELTAQNRLQIWIPRGFAHGFLALEEGTELLYKTTDYYAPECERSILWSDPQLDISWPSLGGKPPVLSEKDATAPGLSECGLFSD